MKNNFEDTIILKNNNISILENEELRELIQFKLDKSNLRIEDLAKIEDIVLNGRKINGDINIVNFEEIDLFKNLKKIELKDLSISENQSKKLENIEQIYFKNCKVEKIDDIKNVKKLIINNSEIEDFYQIENFHKLEELELINMEIEFFEFLKQLKNLKVLKLKNIKDFILEKINFSLPIKYFSVKGIKDFDENYLTKIFSKLEILSVDMEKQEEWQEKLTQIKQRGIRILINDIYEY